MFRPTLNSVVLSVIVVLSLVAVGVTLTGTVAAETGVVQENEVAVDGSTVSINTNGVNSIAIEDLPSDVTVSDISDGGSYNADEESILWTDFGSGLPDQVTFVLTPPETVEAGDTISFDANGEPVVLEVVDTSVDEPPETPSIIDEDTVSLDGSTVTVHTDGANAIDVSNLPSDVGISASDDGSYNADEGSILWTDFGSGLPETVTFTLTPGENYVDGDTIAFTVDGTSVTLQVTETTVSVPDELQGDVTGAQYAAVVGDTGELSASNLSAAINGWSQKGSINGVDIGAPELSALINHWASS